MEQIPRILYKWKDIKILEMSIKKVYIHIFLSVSAKLSISEVIGMLKG